MKFVLKLIKVFFCNLKVTSDGLECHLCDKLIKFNLKYFETHFGLFLKGNEVCISSAHGFVRFDLVKSISKSIFGDHLDMANLNISQVKFEMRILHNIFVKMLYRKPQN